MNGDIYTIKEYFEMVGEGSFMDHDGTLGEALDKNDNIILEQCPFRFPSEIDDLKKFLSQNKRIKKIVWLNK